MRLVVFGGGALLVPLLRRARADNAGGAICVVVGVGLVAVVTAGGHGISGRWVPVAFLATVVHLGAMSVWAGGLVALLCVGSAQRLAVATRFSPVALAAVVTLAATGVLNAWRQAGSLGALTGSGYGDWLYVKLALILIVLGVASQTRRRVRVTSSTDDERPDRRLRRLVAAEVAVMVLVLGATAGLVESAPPRQTLTQPESRTALQGSRLAQVTLDPPVTGGTTMHVYLSTTTGSLDQPIQITVEGNLPSRGIANLALHLENAGPGHVTGGDIDLPVAGTWTITITARYSEFDSTTFYVAMDVH